VTDALVAGARVMEAVHSVGCLTGELVRVYESGHKKTGTKRFVVSFAQFDEAQQRFAESKQRKVVLSSQFVVLQSAVVRDVSTGETRVILCYVDINDGNRQTVFVAEVDACFFFFFFLFFIAIFFFFTWAHHSYRGWPLCVHCIFFPCELCILVAIVRRGLAVAFH
jgi:hypothetical protein